MNKFSATNWKNIFLVMFISMLVSSGVLAKPNKDKGQNMDKAVELVEQVETDADSDQQKRERKKKSDEHYKHERAMLEESLRLEMTNMREKHRAEIDAIRNDPNLMGRERSMAMKDVRALQKKERKALKDIHKERKEELKNAQAANIGG